MKIKKDDTEEAGLSAEETIVVFNPRLPLLREAVPASSSQEDDADPSKWPFELAFSDENARHVSWQACEARLFQQCQVREDTAWHPVWKEEYEASKPLRAALNVGYGPIRPWMSIGHWLGWHFDLRKFRPSEQTRVKISLACVFAFIAIGWPLIIYKTGIAGWVKFWFVPWLGYHFWMSTFTMVHHTAPHIPFKYPENWNAAEAQLGGTVHCDYPRWIEVLCHDINVHIPHHISQRIPSYNLRLAHESLRKNWGKYLNEAKWSWRLMKTIMTTCHIYDEEENYVAFDAGRPQESKIIGLLRRWMPGTA